MKAWIQAVAVLGVAVLGASAYAGLRSQRAEIVVQPRVERRAPVEVLVARPEAVTLELEVFGTVEPAREARVASEVAGRVARIAPEAVEGARVAAGQVLIELDRADLELARVSAAAQVAEAEAALVREEAETKIARRDLERAGVDDPGPLALREPQLAGARAALESARSALRRAELDLDRAILRAPFDALVTAERVELGQVVAPGTLLLDLVSTDAFEIRVALVDRDRALLDPLGTGEFEGPPVHIVRRAAGREARFEGRIVRTLPELDARSRALVAIARVERPLEAEDPLRLGDFVSVTVRGRTIAEAFALPEAAIRTGEQLWLVDAEERLTRRTVTIAQRLDGVALVERGLGLDERVIVSSLEVAPDGLALDVIAGPDEDPR